MSFRKIPRFTEQYQIPRMLMKYRIIQLVRTVGLAALLIFCCTYTANAQKTKQSEQESVTGCVKGDMYFFAGSYNKAYNEYLKFYSRSKNKANPELLLKLTESIINEDMPKDTACFFAEQYMALNPEDYNGVFLAAKAYYHSHKFDKADKYLEEYKKVLSEEKDIAEANDLARRIKNARRMVKDSAKIILHNMGEMINSPANELSPFITADNSVLYFSCDEKYNSGIMLNYFSIKYAENQDLSWTKSKLATGPINTLFDEYVTGVYDGGLLLTSNRTGDFGIFECPIRKGPAGKFVSATKLPPPIDLYGDEVGACMMGNDTIIFSATTLNGKLDLYYSIKVNGKWVESRPLPGEINTELYDENYPTLANNGTRLYFASNNETSMGGYDLYYSDLDPKEFKWGKPVQLPYPINDTFDNMSISFTSDNRYSYVSNVRKEGYGCRDIYCIINDSKAATHAIMKCFVGINTKPKPRPLTQMPLIQVFDTDEEIVSTARLNLQSSTFVLALEPGTYTLRITSEEAEEFETPIVVEEKVYSQDVIQKIFLLTASQPAE